MCPSTGQNCRPSMPMNIVVLSVVLMLSFALHVRQGSAQYERDHDAVSAVYTDDLDGLKQIFSAGVNLSTIEIDGLNLVAIAAARGSFEMLEYLHGAGVDINHRDPQGYTPVMRALAAGRADNALKLRALGADLGGVTDDGYSVRVLAEVAGLDDFGDEPPTYDVLLSQDAASRILLHAAEAGDIASVRLALDNDADLSSAGANDWTPVMLAALGGRADIVELLAERGALGPKGGPLHTVGDNVDAVVLALIGRGNGDLSRVDAVLKVIARHKDLSGSSRLYAAVAKRQGYDAVFIGRHFPADDLPPLEIEIPLVSSNDVASWKRVQRRLNELGLYDMEIDGEVGRGTASALYGLLSGLEPLLIQRSYTAMRRAQAMLERTNGRPGAGYGAFQLGGSTFFGQVRETPRGVVAAGYYGLKQETAEGHSTFEYGYVLDPATGSTIWGWQATDNGRLLNRSLELPIANGSFSIARTRAASVTLDFNEPGNPHEVRFTSDFQSTALPLEPLPGANLDVEPTDSPDQMTGDVIVDYHDVIDQ